MKTFRQITSFLALSILGVSTLGTAACSEDNNTEEIPSEKPEKEPQKELEEKLHQIYDQASTEPQKVTTVNQLAILTSVCASREGTGPISVTPALLNGREVTLVTLGGTQEVEGQATSMTENQLAAFGKPNDYLTAVENLFLKGIVPDSCPVIITGISLGGMIAQQVLGLESITSRFQIEAIITFGSPITLPLDRKGFKVVRFADVNDKVPQLGEMMLRSGLITDGLTREELKATLQQLDDTERIARTSKYSGMIDTHALSYVEDECWRGTDFLGDTDRGNVLELKEAMHFYPAPKLKKQVPQ